MKISRITVTLVNVPFFAPIRCSGGANADWTRIIVEMETSEGLVGLGETLGSSVTKTLIDTEIGPMFLGENPFDIERMRAKATFVPLYYGKCGYCAFAALELACWDLMGKAANQPLCRLLGGKLRDEIPFAAYVYHRNANAQGEGKVNTCDDVIGRARELVDRHGFSTIKYKGGVKTPDEEIEILIALRAAFPTARLRYDPQAIYTPATAIRIGKQLEPLDLEYYEDPCWGNIAMARVRQSVDIPLASNMAAIDLDSAAESIVLNSVDVILGDIFEWGGIAVIQKLKGACEMFQKNLNFHSAGELGIATAAYLHVAASCQSLPHALDTHATELAGDIVKDPNHLTDHATMVVPNGVGLGVALDPERFKLAAEAYRRGGDKSVYAEDEFTRRYNSSKVHVLTKSMLYVEFIHWDRSVPIEIFRFLGRQSSGWKKNSPDRLVLQLGRTLRLGPEPGYLAVWEIPSIRRLDEWEAYFQSSDSLANRRSQAMHRAITIERAGLYNALFVGNLQACPLYYLEFYQAV